MYDDSVYIYSITHLPTNKRYIGRTKRPEKRWRQHLTALEANRHSNKAMQDDYNRIGHDFVYEILERIITTPFVCGHDAEKAYMEKFMTYDERYGYNFNDPMMSPVRTAHFLPPKGQNEIRQQKKRGEP